MFDQLIFQKTSSIDVEPLLHGQVHLWWVSLAITDQQQHAFHALLSEHQQKKLQRLADAEKRRFYIAGRGYLRQFLEHYCSAEQAIELQFGEHGKPSLKNNEQQLCFNYTDTCGYGLFAFSLASQLGIDVESSHRSGKFDRVIQRRFSPEEQYLRDHNVEQFLRCWTRKEAYGKAIGAGLNYPLREHVMCVDLSQSEFKLKNQNWYGQQFSIQQPVCEAYGDVAKNAKENYIACLFSEGENAKTLKTFCLSEN